MEEVTKSNDLCQLPVKKLQDMQVQASETKHYNENYFLNTLDRYQPHVSQTIYCYKSDEKKSSKTVASVIKDALSKVLVHYYPLAGTLMIGNDGKFFVKCTNKGADFVEAEADCEIDVLGDIRIPDTALLGNLVRTFPPETSVIDLRSHVDYIAVKKEDARMSARASLVVVSWTRLSFHTTDFGWGEPYQIGMLKMPGKEVAFFLPVTKNENGITVLLSLPETAMDIFKTQLQICVVLECTS